MLRKMKNMKQNHILSKGERIVLGYQVVQILSVFHVLYRLAPEYGLHLIVVHINHVIRGEEADRDEAFVREICNQWKLEFRSFHFDIVKLPKRTVVRREAEKHKISNVH